MAGDRRLEDALLAIDGILLEMSTNLLAWSEELIVSPTDEHERLRQQLAQLAYLQAMIDALKLDIKRQLKQTQPIQIRTQNNGYH